MFRKHFRFKRLILGLACVSAIAAFGVPAVQAKPTSAYGPLDPWASNVIARTAQANVTGTGNYGPLDPWASNVIARTAQANVTAAGNYGPLDPWAARLLHRSTPTVAAVRTENGFSWSDAGIGASVVFGAALLMLTAVALGRRYRTRFDRSGLATS
jgi:hypothetical protein